VALIARPQHGWHAGQAFAVILVTTQDDFASWFVLKSCRASGRPAWRGLCSNSGMSTLAFKVSRKNGEYVKPALIPANHSEQSHFGMVDGVIVGFFLVCISGLVVLLLRL
jgi:hypothetical protein